MEHSVFKIRKFDRLNLGNYLRRKREWLGLSLEKAADEISVSKKYLQALEDNNFGKLPPAIYVRGFLDRYCRLLDLDSNKATYLFEKSRLIPTKDSPAKSLIAYSWLNRILSYRNLIISIAIFFLLACTFYLFKVIYPLYANPDFSLLNPNTCPFQTYQEKIELKGIIQPESKIWINGEEVLVDKEGSFHCPLFLKEGENTVRFQIINRFGREGESECVIRKD